MNWNKTLLVLALAFSITAISKETLAFGSTDIQIQGQQQGQAQSVDTSVGVSNNIDGADVPRQVPSAVAPSVSSFNDCVIMQQESKAFSLFFISFSGTTGSSFQDICYAFKRQQFDVADKLACMKSRDYARANPACPALLAALPRKVLFSERLEQIEQERAAR